MILEFHFPAKNFNRNVELHNSVLLSSFHSYYYFIIILTYDTKISNMVS